MDVVVAAAAALFFGSASSFFSRAAFGGRGEADRLFRGEVALAGVVGLVGVLGKRPEQGGALGLAGNHDLQHLHRGGRLVESFFAEYPHHFLGEFGIGLWWIQREIAVPGLRDVGEQFFALARQFDVADGGFAAGFVQLRVDQAYPRPQVLGLLGRSFWYFLTFPAKLALGAPLSPVKAFRIPPPPPPTPTPRPTKPDAEQQGEADIDHLDCAATAASSEVEEHRG